MSVNQYRNQIYAGTLGKIIGVYLGRPIEGWAYEDITREFKEVQYYIHKKVGVSLVVADDDISGTYAFCRAIRDYGYNRDITAEDFGNTWLNYIIKDKTILWWGGFGRSTEHTAFFNLRNGITAPRSGSLGQNGKTLAEQVGAQIFIEGIAMACPGNPDLAVELVRKAASVSHDGLAVDAACHLAALDAMAFDEKNVDVLLDKAFTYLTDERLKELVLDVREICRKENDWRNVRNILDDRYGYHLYPGVCHMVPNHALVLAAIILGGDDFQKSVSIAVSAGWDTDCNAGNVGAFNGIRLGLDAINAGADFRAPAADLMYIVTSDGGSVISDAVRESHMVYEMAAGLAGETVEIPQERYSFDFPGSVQGFAECREQGGETGRVSLSNQNEISEENALRISCNRIAKGVSAYVSAPVFIDFSDLRNTYRMVASPTLYSSQKVFTKIRLSEAGEVAIRPYILYYDRDNKIQCISSNESIAMTAAEQLVQWIVPDTKGMPIFKFGYEISAEKRYEGDVIISSIDWKGAPEKFEQKGMLMNVVGNSHPWWLSSFTSSAVHFAADFNQTYCISHPEENGVITMGTEDWENYSLSSTLFFSLHNEGGLVIRSRGHKRYYGAVLTGWNEALLYAQNDMQKIELAKVPYFYKEDIGYNICLAAKGDCLRFYVNDEMLIEVKDQTFKSGSAGFVISEGTVTADGFIINGID